MFDDSHSVNDEEPYLHPPVQGPKRFPKDSFTMVKVTPHSLKLVDAVIDRSADFDRALKEDCEHTLTAYGDLVQAKGKLVSYLARLMDMANDRSLNAQRTSHVRFQ